MKIRDLAEWHGLRAANSGTEDAPKIDAILRFVESWCDRAERLVMTEELATEASSYGEDPRRVQRPSPLEALRETLLPTQAEMGDLPPLLVQQCLLIIASVWEYGGDPLFAEMTIFEQKVVADMKILVDAQAQQKAAAGG